MLDIRNGKRVRPQQYERLYWVITGANREISDMAVQIASAAEQQAAVAQDISQRIEMIRDLASGNAEGSNEVTAASHNLAALAERLHAQVRHFNLGGNAA